MLRVPKLDLKDVIKICWFKERREIFIDMRFWFRNDPMIYNVEQKKGLKPSEAVQYIILVTVSSSHYFC
jgi:hypothetical protein